MERKWCLVFKGTHSNWCTDQIPDKSEVAEFINIYRISIGRMEFMFSFHFNLNINVLVNIR